MRDDLDDDSRPGDTSASDETLRRIPLFSTLPPDDLRSLRSMSRVKTFASGECLFSEGEACRGFYVVLHGRVEIYKLAMDGRKKVLFHAGPGQSFAEAALFGGQSYPAHAEALEETRALLVPKGPFLEFVGKHPPLALRMIEALCLKLRHLTMAVEQMAFFGARARLAQYLLQSAGPGAKPSVHLEGKKKEVAASLGITPETFSRCLREFEEQGMILNEGRDLILRDLERLRQIPLQAPPRA